MRLYAHIPQTETTFSHLRVTKYRIIRISAFSVTQREFDIFSCRQVVTRARYQPFSKGQKNKHFGSQEGKRRTILFARVCQSSQGYHGNKTPSLPSLNLAVGIFFVQNFIGGQCFSARLLFDFDQG